MGEIQQIRVTITFDDFLYNEISEFCYENSIDFEVFFKKLAIRYLINNGGFKIKKIN